MLIALRYRSIRRMPEANTFNPANRGPASQQHDVIALLSKIKIHLYLARKKEHEAAKHIQLAEGYLNELIDLLRGPDEKVES
jgi:hypothetical protein